MASGAWRDVPGMEGITHFLEHLLVPERVRRAGSLLGVTTNAQTSWDEISTVATGHVNLQQPRYGLVPLLTMMEEALADPFAHTEGVQEAIDGQKGRIFGEISIWRGDYRRQVYDRTTQLLLGPHNPAQAHVLGTESSLNAITAADLQDHAARVLLPNGLIISVFTEGRVPSRRLTVKTLVDLFRTFPRAGQKAEDFPWSALDEINPFLERGSVYKINTGTGNGQVSAILAWPVHRELFGAQFFALRHLAALMNQELEHLASRRGLGYIHEASVREPGGELAFLLARVDLNPSIEPDTFIADFPHIMREILEGNNNAGIEGITPQAIDDRIVSNRIREEAVLTTASEVLRWAILGLRRFGRMIDAERVRKINESVSAADIDEWRKTILDQPPVMMLIGDLPRS